MARRYTTRFIVDYLNDLRRPATTSEIRSALKDNGYTVKDTSLNWTLLNLNDARRIRRVRRGVYQSVHSDKPPREPPSGPGPQYEPRNGKLAEIATPPNEDEAKAQASLHHQLRAHAHSLAQSLERVANRFPELANAAKKYSEILEPDVAEVDVTAVWLVGSSLASFAQAYREQNVAQTLADPLEPPLDALLQSVAREHGAYVMGFERGRDLVQRADQFAVGSVRLAEIELGRGRDGEQRGV